MITIRIYKQLSELKMTTLGMGYEVKMTYITDDPNEAQEIRKTLVREHRMDVGSVILMYAPASEGYYVDAEKKTLAKESEEMHQYETLTLADGTDQTLISTLDEMDNRIEALEQKTSKPFLFSKRYSIIDLILFAALSGIIDGIMKGLNIW